MDADIGSHRSGRYGPFGLFGNPSWGDLSFTQIGAVVTGGLAIASFLFLIGFLIDLSLPAFRELGSGLVFDRIWYYPRERYGALAMIYGTFCCSIVALGLATPTGILTAIWISEYLPGSWRLPVKGLVELLAGVPSIVYGLLGIIHLRWFMQEYFRAGDSLLTAGLLLGVMILPTIVSLVDEAFQAVPASRRHQARAIGLSREETIRAVVLPGSVRGIIAAGLLALSRALGETIAVYLVVGRSDNQLPDTLFTLAPLLSPGQTLTSKLGGAEVPLAYGDPIHMGALAGLGVILITITVLTTLIGHAAMRRSGDAT